MDVTIGPIGRTRERPLRHLDPVLLVVTMALSVIGLFMVYSSSRTFLQLSGADPATELKKAHEQFRPILERSEKAS